MNSVDPIRNKDDVNNLLKYLKNHNERDYIMALTGIYSGYRISDILQLKVKDFKGQNYFYFRERKTGKQTKLLINPILKNAANEYIINNALSDDDYMFKSQKGYNRPIGRQRAHKIISEAAKTIGIHGNYSTHSLRKTMGYHYYKQTHDIVTLQAIFNHSSPAVTLIYIGVTQDIINDNIKDFRI